MALSLHGGGHRCSWLPVCVRRGRFLCSPELCPPPRPLRALGRLALLWHLMRQSLRWLAYCVGALLVGVGGFCRIPAISSTPRASEPIGLSSKWLWTKTSLGGGRAAFPASAFAKKSKKKRGVHAFVVMVCLWGGRWLACRMLCWLVWPELNVDRGCKPMHLYHRSSPPGVLTSLLSMAVSAKAAAASLWQRGTLSRRGFGGERRHRHGV